jgi:hypothetical protein
MRIIYTRDTPNTSFFVNSFHRAVIRAEKFFDYGVFMGIIVVVREAIKDKHRRKNVS